MSRAKVKPIDPVKLESQFQERGLTLSEASKKIYKNPGFFRQMMRPDRRKITQTTLSALEERMGIYYEDIKPDEPKEEEPEQVAMDYVVDMSQAVVLDYPTVERYVHKAVAEAIENRLPNILGEIFCKKESDFYKVIGKAMYVSCKYAMREALIEECSGEEK